MCWLWIHTCKLYNKVLEILGMQTVYFLVKYRAIIRISGFCGYPGPTNLHANECLFFLSKDIFSLLLVTHEITPQQTSKMFAIHENCSPKTFTFQQYIPAFKVFYLIIK